MTKKQKRLLIRIIVAAVMFAVGILYHWVAPEPASEWPEIVLMVGAWALVGYDVVWAAVRNIGHGQIFDEKFLMALATVGAFALGDWAEAAAVMIFFQTGELFESVAVQRSRQSIAGLMDLRPDFAIVLENGQQVEKQPEEVQIGDILLVRPGERVPIDGVIIDGSATLDTSKITGESVPSSVKVGDTIVSGCVNLSGVLQIKAKSAYEQSTVAKILELVESAADQKASTERMITRFAKYYTPTVVIAAALLAVIPPLFFSLKWAVWVKRALTFLVISCPCALVISVPLSYFGGMGAASKLGVVVKGGTVLEQLAKAEIAVFDKTGTLTTGEFSVRQVNALSISKEELLHLTAAAETYSIHPVSAAIRKAAGESAEPEDTQEIPGCGICARVEGKQILAGNRKLMEQYQIAYTPCDAEGTIVYVACDDTFLGSIVVGDTVRSSVDATMRELKKNGVKRTVMLTGDVKNTAQAVAQAVGIDEYHAKLLPQDKVNQMEQLCQRPNPAGTVLFVGDGVNDAPVLAMADVGVAMGGVGSDAAVEAADVVILNDDIGRLPKIIRIARKTGIIAKENIVFALAIKAVVLVLGAFGYTPMWLAIFADVGVAVLAILNALRTMTYQ